MSSQKDFSTRNKKGTQPPNVTLEEIAKDLLLYIGGSPHLNKTEKKIEKKYNIKKQPNNCWPEDDIKRAWGKTQRMDKTLLKRKRWALAILLQLIKRSGFDFNRKEAQSDQNNTVGSIQSCAEESMGNTSNQIQSETNTVGSKGSASGSQHQSHSEKEYIRVPLSVMFRSESDSAEGERKVKGSTTYKLIDRLPSCPEIKTRKSYVLLYNNQTRNAAWVYEILNKSTTAAKEHNEKSKYVDDLGISLYHAHESMTDINESDYNHGHLAAAANHRWCKKAHEDTYFLSNIAPQTEYLNKEMEKLEKQWLHQIENDQENKICNVHMYTGPLYQKSDKRKKTETLKIWKTKVVPTHFFKVVIVEKEDGTVEAPICYELPNVKSEAEEESKQSKNKNKQSTDKNNENTLDRYIVSITDIDTKSGLRFRERGCTEGEIDSTRTGKWKGETNDKNAKPPCVEIKVRISTPLTDYDSLVYI